MAYQMTHMIIAYRLMDTLGINIAREDFILGSVAPDSVHFSENVIPRKIHSHLFENSGPWGDTQDYDNWLSNINAFARKYVVNEQDTSMKAFLLGIVVHCLTDYWNDLLIWRGAQKRFIPPLSFDEFLEGYRPEYLRIDRWLYQNTENAGKIMQLLENSKERDFEDYVRADDIVRMKDHLLHKQYDLPDPVDVSQHKYITSEIMQAFLDEVLQKVPQMVPDHIKFL